MVEDHKKSPGEAKSLPNREGRRTGAERRRYARFPMSASVEAVELNSKARIVGRTSDLGLGGCYVDTISPLPIGSVLKMRLTHDNKAFETKAQVVVAAVGMGMGVIFIDTEPAQVQTLEGWIRELSGEVLVEPDLPQIRSEAQSDAREGQPSALHDLVVELIRTGALSESKGAALLRKLEANRSSE